MPDALLRPPHECNQLEKCGSQRSTDVPRVGQVACCLTERGMPPRNHPPHPVLTSPISECLPSHSSFRACAQLLIAPTDFKVPALKGWKPLPERPSVLRLANLK